MKPRKHAVAHPPIRKTRKNRSIRLSINTKCMRIKHFSVNRNTNVECGIQGWLIKCRIIIFAFASWHCFLARDGCSRDSITECWTRCATSLLRCHFYHLSTNCVLPGTLREKGFSRKSFISSSDRSFNNGGLVICAVFHSFILS